MIINFDENYNNKLNSNIFTTIRKNSNKYVIDKTYEIHLNNQFLFKAKIIDKAVTYFFNVNGLVLCCDTGMDLEESIDFFINKFKMKQGDEVQILLLKKIKLEEV